MKPSTLLKLGLGLLVLARLEVAAQPIPHHFSGLEVLPDQTVALSLDGSVSNMFSLPATISNQFMQMFDLYLVDTSTNLADWTPLARLLRTNNNTTRARSCSRTPMLLVRASDSIALAPITCSRPSQSPAGHPRWAQSIG